MIRTAGLSGRILQMKPDETELTQLYKQAAALIYPSLYEGFGIPVLEAFSQNLPVLLSNRSCLPEIAGEAALYFDPEKPDAIADAVRRILSEGELRRQLIQNGRKRLKDFSWERSAREIRNFYRKCFQSVSDPENENAGAAINKISEEQGKGNRT